MYNDKTYHGLLIFGYQHFHIITGDWIIFTLQIKVTENQLLYISSSRLSIITLTTTNNQKRNTLQLGREI